jgi:hypothetical protein
MIRQRVNLLSWARVRSARPGMFKQEALQVSDEAGSSGI